jgi:hypothetical protein
MVCMPAAVKESSVGKWARFSEKMAADSGVRSVGHSGTRRELQRVLRYPDTRFDFHSAAKPFSRSWRNRGPASVGNL